MGFFDDVGSAIGNITNPINANLSNLGNNINRNASDLGNNINRNASDLGNNINKYLDNLFNPKKPNIPVTDFNSLTSKWDQLQSDIGGRLMQQNVQDVAAQSQQGVGSSMQALGQKGGLGIGGAQRLQGQSKWDMAQGAADAAQAANEMGTQFAMNKVMGVDLPVLQGKEMAAAQRAAADASYVSPWQDALQIAGTVGGTLIGGTLGGPIGAMAGSQLGGQLGRRGAQALGNGRG